MNRRETIKTLAAASGLLVTLPSWAEGWIPAQMMSGSAFLTPETQKTLASVADTIIPAGDKIGALAVGVDKFLQKLIADCYEPEVQDNVSKQLSALETVAGSRHGKPFGDCDQAQRESMLLGLAASGDPEEEAFFKLIKSETIRGFNTSREVMVKYHQFRQVPGYYHGCVDVTV